MTDLDVTIIGGGITGLTAAYDLIRQNMRVAVLEASSRAGGLIQTDHVEGLTIEAGPDSLLAAKPAALALIDEIGIGARVQHVRPPGGAFVLRGRRLYRLPSPSLLGLPLSLSALARYDLLPPVARLRLALEPFIGVPTSNVGPRDGDESVASFFRRRFGAATVDLIAQPLLGGIHAGDIEQLSMRALFPRLLALEAQYGSVLHGARRTASTLNAGSHTPRASAFVSLRGGMHTLVEALLQRLGDVVRLNTPVSRLEPEGDAWRVEVPSREGGSHENAEVRFPPSGRRSIAARDVIIAAPAFVAAELLRPIDADAAALCARMPYVSTASIALAWPRAAVPHPLHGTGFVVARRHSDARLTACTWVSQKWEDRAPEGTVLMRAFIGGAHDPAAVDLDDTALVDIARRDLRAVLGVSEAPSTARVYRWHNAGAQHLVGQVARMDALDARLARHPGLYVAGSGFRSVGIPDCIADAHRVAEWISIRRSGVQEIRS